LHKKRITGGGGEKKRCWKGIFDRRSGSGKEITPSSVVKGIFKSEGRGGEKEGKGMGEPKRDITFGKSFDYRRRGNG